MARLGQLRSTSGTGGKALYLLAGFCIMTLLREFASMDEILRKMRRQVLAFYVLNNAK
jgi:hypothetical protein